ncbi:MAG: alpha-glucuronidase [Lachnospiraceae bacterium]|nr:alpha-glucuronidase [Lachnospiraceae bacterium]
MSYEFAWLDYRNKATEDACRFFKKITLCGFDAVDGSEENILFSAVEELKKASVGISGSEPEIIRNRDASDTGINVIFDKNTDETDGAYLIFSGECFVSVRSGSARGILYGVFRAIVLIRTGRTSQKTEIREIPASPIRMLDHWDNPDGTIERGYSGRSFFFANDHLLVNDRTKEYARLVASVGINAVAINNVNVNNIATGLVSGYDRKELACVAKIFGDYGIKLFISLNFASPMSLGDTDTADPLDERVAAWWKKAADGLYADIPDLGGFLVKADSEGRPGPFSYGRTHADGANMLARALSPHNGLLIWRCFVYNCQQDWRDLKTDRARACFDNFIGLDGQFDDNVILQIKNGPMDFQVREPVSPLFGGLKKTNMMVEFQLAQEYTGQQKDVCYLIPMFRQVLDFKTYNGDGDGVVRDIVTGKGKRLNCGMVAVSNTGNDPNWTGHDLAAANLYGFGRLSFVPCLSPEDIADEWSRITFGNDDVVAGAVSEILMMSWPAYEKYTSPLGIGWMISPGHHYGPDVEGYEFSPWGTYHRSDRNGLGVERGRQGTGFIDQYNEPNRSIYGSLETCPDELVLFFHRLNYDYVLKSGKTVIEHIYDSHFEGVHDVEKMIDIWNSIKDRIDEKRFDRVTNRFDMQLKNACEWRDRINTYYHRHSGIPDKLGRKIY